MEKEENLQTDKRSPRVWTESVTAKIMRFAKDRLQLTVEQSPIVQWIHHQLEKNVKDTQSVKRNGGWNI